MPVEAGVAAVSDGLVGLLARRLGVLAEPTRLRILLTLEQHDATVQELADGLGVAHQSASKHLNVLLGAGLLSRRREGSYARYALADYAVCLLVRQATAGLTGYIEELADLTDRGS